MPRRPTIVLCGAAAGRQGPKKQTLHFNLAGAQPNPLLRLEHISRLAAGNLSDTLIDLIEIAAYVYAADASVTRGGTSDPGMGKHWRRNFEFVIPVRNPDLWRSAPVLTALTETLGFLSDDDYTFRFEPFANRAGIEGYFEFGDDASRAFRPDVAILFSGGLDSLAGAVDILAGSDRSVVLVSHRSATKITSVQNDLVKELQHRYGAQRVKHVPVLATLQEDQTKETTHRSRSFLFAALGAATAQLFGLDDILFFENGVVSLNLPVASQVVGARATRTTHPQVLAGLRRLLSAITGQRFGVDNPFLWRTKTEVTAVLATHGQADLIPWTRSCTRVHEMTRLHTHCGRCSQCLDRRFGILAAGLDGHDSAESYSTDLFTGERPAGPDREMALAYVRSATAIRDMPDAAFFARFGEASRVVGCFEDTANVIGERIFDMHLRHARSVCDAFDAGVRQHASQLREGVLHAACLLRLVTSGDTIGEADAGERALARIELVINRSLKTVAVGGWGELKGVSARLIIALAQAIAHPPGQGEPTDASFINSGVLAEQMGGPSGEALRRQIQRCREAITKLARDAGAPPPDPGGIVENLPWHGYRLNSDRVSVTFKE